MSGVSFCSKCGAPVEASADPDSSAAAAAPAAATGSGIDNNVAGALAYVTPIPAIIFLLTDPYKNIGFVRFHSLQCIFFCIASIVLQVCVAIASVALGFIGIGAIVALLSPLISLGILVIWVVLVLKAYQGQEFALPLIGPFVLKHV